MPEKAKTRPDPKGGKGHGPLVTEDPQKTPDEQPTPEDTGGGGGVLVTDDPAQVKRKDHVRKEWD